MAGGSVMAVGWVWECSQYPRNALRGKRRGGIRHCRCKL